MGLNVGQSTRRTNSELMHWTSGVYKESLAFVGVNLSEMLTFVTWAIIHHSHPLSSLVVFLSLGTLREWMRMQTPAKSFLSLFPRAGVLHPGSHAQRGWRPSNSKAVSLPWMWSCMKPENWLRIDLSEDWCLCIVHATIALDYCVDYRYLCLLQLWLSAPFASWTW